jgi:hypothetical protein
MTHRDSGWRPDVGLDSYKGKELWDHGIGPHEVNDGNREPEDAADDE